MSLSEKILNLCGHEIWPPTHNDPRIKGPQPRIITKRQKEWMEKLQRENEAMVKPFIAVARRPAANTQG